MPKHPFGVVSRKLNKPLSEIRNASKGLWNATETFNLVQIAFEWKVRPSFLGACEPEEDAAVMIAYTEVISKMRAIEEEENERKAELATLSRG